MGSEISTLLLESDKLSVLINGNASPKAFFACSRGVRQDKEILSPLLHRGAFTKLKEDGRPYPPLEVLPHTLCMLLRFSFFAEVSQKSVELSP